MKTFLHAKVGFSVFTPMRAVFFAGPEKEAPKPEAKKEAPKSTFDAPKDKPDTKKLEELKKDNDLTVDKIQKERGDFKKKAEDAKKAADASFEASGKTDKDKQAYDTFSKELAALKESERDIVSDLGLKLSEIGTQREKKLKEQLAIKDAQNDWKNKFKPSENSQKADLKALTEKYMGKAPDGKDPAAGDKVLQEANGFSHDFAGWDNQSNSSESDKRENYTNDTRSATEGYLRAMSLAGKGQDGLNAVQAAYHKNDWFGDRIDPEDIASRVGIDESTLAAAGLDTKVFLTKNEPVYIATLLKVGQEKLSPEEFKAYGEFVKKQLAIAGPELMANMSANKDFAEGTAGVHFDKDDRRFNAACAKERNLIMNVVPSPDDWKAGKATRLDNPGLTEADLQKEGERRSAYAKQIGEYIGKWDSLYGNGPDSSGNTKEQWKTSADATLEKNPDGSFKNIDGHGPEDHMKGTERMKDDAQKKLNEMKGKLEAIKTDLPFLADEASGHLAKIAGKHVFEIGADDLKKVSDYVKQWDAVMSNPEAKKRLTGGAPEGDKPVEPGKPGETPTPAVGPDGKPVPVPATEGGTPAPAGDSPGGGKGGKGGRGGKGGGEGGKGEKGKEGTEKTVDNLKEDAAQLEGDTKGEKTKFDAIKDKKAGDADKWAEKAKAWKETADKWVEKAKEPKTDALKSQKDATEADVAAKKAVENLKKATPEKTPDVIDNGVDKLKDEAAKAKGLADAEKAKFEALPKDTKPEDVLKAAQSYLAKAKDWQKAAKGWAEKDGKNADATGMKDAADKMVATTQEAVKAAQEAVRDNTPTIFEPDLAKLTLKDVAFRKRYDALVPNRKSNYDDYMKLSLRAQEVVASGKQLKFENGSSKYPAVAFLKNGKVFWKPGRDPEAKVPVIKNLNEWYMDKLEKEGQRSPESVEKDFNGQIEARLSRVEKDAAQYDRVNKNLPLGYIGNGFDSRKMTVSPSITYVPGPNPGRPVGSVDGPRYEYFIDKKKVDAGRDAFKKAILDNIKSIPENNG